jgi:hypothetical protein
MDNNYFETTSKWFWLAVVVIGSICLVLGSPYLMYLAFVPKYFDLLILSIGIFICLCGVLGLVTTPYYFPKVVIQNNLVTIDYRIKSKSFLIEEITNFECHHHVGEYGLYSYDELTIYLRQEKIKLYSNAFNNFEDLKKILTDNKKEGKPDDAKKTIWGFLILLAICLPVSYWVIGSFLNPDSDLVNRNDLTEVTGTLKFKPETMREGKYEKKIELNLVEYPDFNFKIGSIAFDVTSISNFLFDVNQGDTVMLYITKDDFNKKLKELIPMTFWEKHLHHEMVDIYELRNKNYQYLTLDDYNSSHSSNTYGLKWVFLLFAIGLLYWAFYEGKAYFWGN